ncbi:class A beta-lactamase [Mycolicibacterium flavescens]|uniref:Beta-lactamase n=1 Tax=Mycolicibacterium flavescens TaxID=1776 RepID=A0A1E3RC76_MYCFV|nr:class A beta-lactamase [Mycolicibacterium flavescens]MCV7278525.1 class A beta-lactamase [Mycolicibacterium flavescens]ODQ87439.1 class A beta-lactamase [Mycolicibacterium flavescens]
MTALSRRRVLAGGLALAGLAASPISPALAQPVPLESRLRDLEREHHALIGVFATNLDTGRTVAHRAAESFAMCSTFKTYAAARVLQLVERGELSLDRRVRVDAADIVAHSPRTQPRVAGDMTVDELCQAAVQVSDNAAANLLLRTIGGPPAITAFARSIGDQRSRLDRWELELNAAVPGDPRDTTSPEAIGGGYRALLTGTALAAPQRELLQRWMRANETSSMRAGLPAGWTTADKTGSGDYASTNDVGVAYGPNGERLLLSLMIRTAGDDADAPGLRPVIGQLAALLVPHLLG